MTTSAWRVGQRGTVTVTVTSGAWPVHTVTFDLPNDGLPAWQVITEDARPTLTVPIGPFARAQTTTLTTVLMDERGCTTTVTQPVTVGP